MDPCAKNLGMMKPIDWGCIELPPPIEQKPASCCTPTSCGSFFMSPNQNLYHAPGHVEETCDLQSDPFAALGANGSTFYAQYDQATGSIEPVLLNGEPVSGWHIISDIQGDGQAREGRYKMDLSGSDHTYYVRYGMTIDEVKNSAWAVPTDVDRTFAYVQHKVQANG